MKMRARQPLFSWFEYYFTFTAAELDGSNDHYDISGICMQILRKDGTTRHVHTFTPSGKTYQTVDDVTSTTSFLLVNRLLKTNKLDDSV
jgi:hypothetical protein